MADDTDQQTRLTACRLRAVLSYDAETGVFTRNTTRGGRLAGSVTGTLNPLGYIVIRVDGRLYLAHRLAVLFSEGRWPVQQVDHINGNRSDNRYCNLRECSNAENCQNVSPHRDSSSGHAGVCFAPRNPRNPWIAQICVDGRQRRIGAYPTLEQAIAARAAEKANLHQFQPVQRKAS